MAVVVATDSLAKNKAKLRVINHHLKATCESAGSLGSLLSNSTFCYCEAGKAKAQPQDLIGRGAKLRRLSVEIPPPTSLSLKVWAAARKASVLRRVVGALEHLRSLNSLCLQKWPTPHEKLVFCPCSKDDTRASASGDDKHPV